jgi:checkpoint serine/threonine-protein kinase
MEYSFYLEENIPNGTLKNIMNTYTNSKKNMDEMVIMYYTMEMLKILDTLHNECQIIHNDFNSDNILLNHENCDKWEHWSKTGWEGLKVIDFDKSIDMTLFPTNMKFIIPEKYHQFLENDEIEEGWTYQIDTFGFLSVIYQMFFFKELELIKNENGLSPKNQFKRFYQTQLWNSLFDQLLNKRNEKPDYKNLINLFENYFIQNERKSKGLRGLLINQNAMYFEN